jgi:YVTN family beta-propeller protein
MIKIERSLFLSCIFLLGSIHLPVFAHHSQILICNHGAHSTGDSTLYSFDIDHAQSTPTPLYTLNIGKLAEEVVVSSDLRFAYVCSYGTDVVYRIDLSNPNLKDEIEVGEGPKSIALTPDNTLACVCNYKSNSLSIIDLQTLVVKAQIDVGEAPSYVAITPDGTYACVCSCFDTTISFIALKNSFARTDINLKECPTSLILTPDGRYVCVGIEYADSVALIDLANAFSVTYVQVGESPGPMVITPDRRYLCVCNQGGSSITCIDLKNSLSTTEVQVGDNPSGITVTPDNKYLCVANAISNTVSLLAPQKAFGRIDIPVGVAPAAIASTFDSRYICVCNTVDGSVSIIDLKATPISKTDIHVGDCPLSIAVVTHKEAVEDAIESVCIPPPPKKFTGKFKKRGKKCQIIASWLPVNTEETFHYEIFQFDSLVATIVPPTPCTVRLPARLSGRKHKPSRKALKQLQKGYSLRAVDSEGRVSQRIFLRIRP